MAKTVKEMLKEYNVWSNKTYDQAQNIGEHQLEKGLGDDYVLELVAPAQPKWGVEALYDVHVHVKQ